LSYGDGKLVHTKAEIELKKISPHTLITTSPAEMCSNIDFMIFKMVWTSENKQKKREIISLRN